MVRKGMEKKRRQRKVLVEESISEESERDWEQLDRSDSEAEVISISRGRECLGG